MKNIKHNETYKEFVEQLIALREAKGLTQRELASLTDMPQPQIARFESLSAQANLSTIFRLLDAMDLKLAIIPKGVNASFVQQANKILLDYAEILNIKA